MFLIINEPLKCILRSRVAFHAVYYCFSLNLLTLHELNYFPYKFESMEEQLHKILEGVREAAFRQDLLSYSISEVSAKLGIPINDLKQYFSSDQDLVEKVLAYERDSFQDIFETYNFEGVNAIDILLTVSREVSNRFKDVSPALTFSLKSTYPKLYQFHIEKRFRFISEKIKINILKGINQGIYRDDLSVELLSRIYISRLIDLHNPDFFPSEEYSFNIIFDTMFDHFIRGIVNEEGARYYEKCRKRLKFENI
jgi:TetR/AcrR family transcriptional regulator, cholesterol catabolism regulator